MDTNDINNTLRQRSNEVDKIIDRLKSKLFNANKDSELINIVTDQREKLLVSEIENKNLKHEILSLKSRLKADEKIFYMLNDLKKENIALKNELSACSKMDNEVFRKNFTNLMEEMERIKSESASRMHLLEQKAEKLENELDEKQAELKKIIDEYDKFKGESHHNIKYVEETKNEIKSIVDEYEKYKGNNNVNHKNVRDLENKIKNIVEEYDKFKCESDVRIEVLREENEKLQRELMNKMDQYENTIEILRRDNLIKDNLLNTLKENENIHKIQLEQFNTDILTFKNMIIDYRNEIIDLKGNIRVYCRVRPVLTNDSRYNLLIDANTVNIEGTKFLFDKIYDPSHSQDDIFRDVNFLVHSIFDGYNSCIFAYGQTGSGKTYTMEGEAEHNGIIPRSMDEIFNLCDTFTKSGWETKIIVSYIEIYNESIRDLLSEPDLNIKYEIKHEGENTFIKNCKYIEITNRQEAMEILNLAKKQRSVGSTKCNDRSSRSHSVFTLTLEIKNKSEIRKGTMNLIDLAGSERLTESGSEGIRLRETQNINKSLSALGNVMSSLLKNDTHVPFRNSKLTYLMQNYLSGKARVLMFVNVSPEIRHFNETLCSLRFASNVSECKLGQANKNIRKKL